MGLPELGRDRDRRRALLQARAQQRRRRPARRAFLLPDEVAAQPTSRQPGAVGHREVHRQVWAPTHPGRQSPSRKNGRRREQRDSDREPGGEQGPEGDAEGVMMAGPTASSERFSIAHVTPYPWEAQENE